MATVRNVIELQDKMSTSLKKIEKELKTTQKLMKDVNDIMGDTNDTIDDFGNYRQISKFNDELDETRRKSKQVKNSFEDMQDSMDIFKGTFMGNIVADMFSSMINGIKNTITGAISYASDLQEVQNVVDTTFEKNAQTVNDWSKTTLKDFGLNELSAKNYASTLGAMMKSSGLAEDQMLQMSMGLTQLIGDVASFRNLKPEEAFYKMKSVITGETEPMKELGVVMTEVNLNAYAMEKGIKTSYREMDQASKIALRYNYVMESLADAQGDFSKTQGSFANQSKLLTENWSAFTAQIATYVVPVLAILLQGLNAVITFLSDHSESVVIALTTLAVILGLVAAKALMAGSANLIAGIQATIAWLGPLLPILLIIAAIGILLIILNEFGISVSQVIGFVSALFVGFGSTVYNLFVVLYNVIATFVNFFANIFKNPIASVKTLFYDMAITVIGFIRDIATSIEKLLNSIPFVEVEITSGLDDVYSHLKANKQKIKEESDLQEVMQPLEFMDSAQMATEAYQGTTSAIGNISSMLSSLGDVGKNIPNVSDLYGGLGGTDLGSIGSLGKDNDIDKVGSVGKIEDDVSITDEDIELMKDVAKVDYVNKFTTMNPSVNVSFGDVHETADVNEITKVISGMVKESIATSLV